MLVPGEKRADGAAPLTVTKGFSEGTQEWGGYVGCSVHGPDGEMRD